MQRSPITGTPISGRSSVASGCEAPTHGPCRSVCWGCRLRCSLLQEGAPLKGWSGVGCTNSIVWLPLHKEGWTSLSSTYLCRTLWSCCPTWPEHVGNVLKTETFCKPHTFLEVSVDWCVAGILFGLKNLMPLGCSLMIEIGLSKVSLFRAQTMHNHTWRQ